MFSLFPIFICGKVSRSDDTSTHSKNNFPTQIILKNPQILRFAQKRAPNGVPFTLEVLEEKLQE